MFKREVLNSHPKIFSPALENSGRKYENMFQVTCPVTLKLSLENKLVNFFCKFQKINILYFFIFFSFCILHSFKTIKSNLSSQGMQNECSNRICVLYHNLLVRQQQRQKKACRLSAERNAISRDQIYLLKGVKMQLKAAKMIQKTNKLAKYLS